jgi:hypothetical protein
VETPVPNFRLGFLPGVRAVHVPDDHLIPPASVSVA